MEKVTRRNFVAGGAAIMGALALGATASQASAAEAMAQAQIDEAGGADREALANAPRAVAQQSSGDWDEEADVVVVGFGFAGETAAIAAADAGASVIVLEKAAEPDAGGNSSVCGGGAVIANPDYLEEANEFIRFQTPDTIDDEEIAGFVDECMTLPAWLEEHGANNILLPFAGGNYGNLPSSVGFDQIDYPEGNGPALWAYLHDLALANPSIAVEFETPAKRLVFDPDTKEVFGVVAIAADGTEKRVKAKRGVVLGLGGFEGNHFMKTSYMPPKVPIYPCGTPYNTGDGIAMVEEVNAQLRGFSSTEWGCHCCKPASDEIGVAVGHDWINLEVYRNSVVVNAKGERFVDEGASISDSFTSMRPIHLKGGVTEIEFDEASHSYRNLPFFMICDSVRINDGPLFPASAEASNHMWSNVHKWYTWSEDNQAEIERGWVQQADTLEELAEKLGIDAEGLVATVDRYNGYCETGEDLELGRVNGLTPVLEPPFYGCELGMSIINTQGGARRDAAHHVISNNGNPVPRLYSAGEFGSIYVFLYQGGGNVPEALAGRTAGANAAAEEPWE